MGDQPAHVILPGVTAGRRGEAGQRVDDLVLQQEQGQTEQRPAAGATPMAWWTAMPARCGWRGSRSVPIARAAARRGHAPGRAHPPGARRGCAPASPGSRHGTSPSRDGPSARPPRRRRRRRTARPRAGRGRRACGGACRRLHRRARPRPFPLRACRRDTGNARAGGGVRCRSGLHHLRRRLRARMRGARGRRPPPARSRGRCRSGRVQAVTDRVREGVVGASGAGKASSGPVAPGRTSCAASAVPVVPSARMCRSCIPATPGRAAIAGMRGWFCRRAKGPGGMPPGPWRGCGPERRSAPVSALCLSPAAARP